MLTKMVGMIHSNHSVLINNIKIVPIIDPIALAKNALRMELQETARLCNKVSEAVNVPVHA